MQAAHCTDGAWNSSGTLTLAAQALYGMLNCSTKLSLRHEYGHASHPHNEFVDGICTMFNHGRLVSPWFQEQTPVRSVALRPEASQWFCLAILDAPRQRQYPVVFKGDDI